MKKPYALLTEREKELMRAAGRRWYLRNRAKKLQANAAWIAANPEKYREINRSNARRYYAEGRYKDRNQAWETKNRKSRTLAARKSHLKSNYGLTEEAYNAMIEAQAGLCNMCTEPMNPVKGTHVDHDHVTGKVRGLLCSKCNLALGHMECRPLVIDDAVAYLKASE